MHPDVAAWEQAGRRLRTPEGDEVFVAEAPAAVTELAPPLLLVHGFPTSSFDWRHVWGDVNQGRRLLAPDLLGYGLSDKPDRPYSLFDQADLLEHLVGESGLDEVDLLTHDMGASVGGELLARDREGDLDFGVRRRVVTNGSVYLDDARLRDVQEELLAMPDAALDEDLPREVVVDGLGALFGRDGPPEGELAAQWELVSRAGGTRLAPRLIRYLGERRQHEGRWTGAIEEHPAPLTILWGDADPVAVVAVADRLRSARPAADYVRLPGVGHFPMIETPSSFARVVLDALS